MNHRSKSYHVLKPFSFYDDLSDFACFISRITLKMDSIASEDATVLKEPWQ